MRAARCLDCGAIFAYKGHIYCPRCGGTIRITNTTFRPRRRRTSPQPCYHCGVNPDVRYINSCPYCGWAQYSPEPITVCPRCHRGTKIRTLG